MADEEDLIPTLTHATERDVDLLLVEELTASAPFLQLVAERAGWTGRAEEWRVLHSKRRTRNRREIDIHVAITPAPPARGVTLLIENKLDAAEQPDQAESYRAELSLLKDSHDFAAMILFCPTHYCAQHSTFAAKFDAVINYEELAGWLGSRAGAASDDETARRLRFRADLLMQAADKGRRGYTAVSNPVIGSFNARYVQLLLQLAPEIIPGPSMLKPENPDESVSMIYDAAGSLTGLPDELRPRRFSHEFGRNQVHRANYVAVTFGGWGVNFRSIEEHLLEEASVHGFAINAQPATKTRPNPGLVLSRTTPAVDNQSSFDSQIGRIEMGIRVAGDLRRWLLENQIVLQRLRRLCLS